MANEQYSFGNLPLLGAGYGIRTHFGILLPPGSKVAAFVRSTGIQDGDDAAIVDKHVTTLAAGLARCRAGMGDTVMCLPGHSESVADATMLDGLKAGTKVIGVPLGASTPTFRWTATASQWVIDDANCLFAGLLLKLEGANGVVKAINVTGSATTFQDCDFEVASGATAKATIALEVGTGAHMFKLLGTRWKGTATHNVTDGVKIVAAITDYEICGNKMIFSATAGNGNIHVTAAALNGYIANNDLYNTHTNSTACIALDDVASDGIACYNNVATAVGTGTAPASAGIVLAGTNTLWRFFGNLSTPTKNTSGITVPVVDS